MTEMNDDKEYLDLVKNLQSGSFYKSEEVKNNVDRQYLDLLKDILLHGNVKETRSGKVYSIFGRSMRFNLKEGLPMLTTKKMFGKGVIHELLWFLKGNTNIKYLVDNGVHIWDDDAYRWYKELIDKNVEPNTNHRFKVFNDNGEEIYTTNNSNKIKLDKETFLCFVKAGAKLRISYKLPERDLWVKRNVNYRFGDLGPVYGKQWRKFGKKHIDQVQNIIDALKNNPDDRRMILTGWNPDVLDEVALPACHTFSQFYTRPLSNAERITVWYNMFNLNEELYDTDPNSVKSEEYKLHKDYFHYNTLSEEELIKIIDERYDVPKRELSLSFYCRSQDYLLGTPFNLLSYGILCHIIANVCNMTVGDLVYFAGDVHVYANQINGVKEQITRKGYHNLPKLVIKRKLDSIDDISYDDFEIKDYHSDPVIKMPLSVG